MRMKSHQPQMNPDLLTSKKVWDITLQIVSLEGTAFLQQRQPQKRHASDEKQKEKENKKKKR